MIGAGSSTAEYTGTKRRRSQVEQARPNQDMINLEVESKYDVFLSSAFGITGFAYDLYNHLTAEGICVFKDDEIPNTSEEFPLSVYNSKIYVPIFAECYADNSRWLDTLALMVEQTYSSGGKKAILPIFCNGDGQLETTSVYRGALDTWTKNYGPEKAERWKKAVVEAGKFSKWRLRLTRGERAITTDIVGNILHKLMMEQNYKSGDLSTGDNPMSYHGTSELEDRQKSKIMELLELEVNDIRVVGIHGRDGIGKTTLAKNIYDQICLRFDACSFLAEIEQTTEQPGGVRYLQTKLIFDILKKECEVASAFKGVRYLKEIFRNMKVLIVLDDVESESLLKDFVGAKLDWFGPGSRIIVTSKEGRVFQDFVARGLAHIYDVIPMDVNLAFNILWQNAVGIGKSDKLSPYVIGMDVNRAFDVLWQNPSGIRKSGELRSYVKIAIVIVKAAKGLPLLLKVFGSFLRYKRLENWIKFEDLIQQFQEDHQKILRIIYDALDQQQKQMYLDIACFPPDVDYGIASCMLHHFVYPQDKIRFLHVRCLITMEKNKIGMHSMLRCLARKIIREGFHDPGTGVGLDLPAIAQDTNERKKGTDHLNTEEAGFEIPPDTTFLSLGDANIGGHFANALLKVRWLHWQGCPRDAINIHLEKNENLVILDLSWSKFTESWEGWKRIKMERLKVLNLTGCVDLLVTPSFSCCPKLELLILERCSRLVHLDPSINDLKLLVTLNLKFCSELSMLPVEMGGMNALKELLIDGTSIRELPESIGKLVQLQILSATNCFSLARVPGSVCGLEDLKELAMDDGKFLELPESLGNLWRLRRLSLRNCRGLGKLPESIGKLQYSLVELDISGTGISRLPDSTKCLCRLKVLKMDSCFLREFPDYIGKLSSLEEINASWCRSLEGVIPSSIWRLKFLKELRLRGTRISSLPPQIEYIHGLQTLDLLHCNLLQELPMLCPRDLSCLYVNPDFKQKMLERSEYRSWWRLLQ